MADPGRCQTTVRQGNLLPVEDMQGHCRHKMYNTIAWNTGTDSAHVTCCRRNVNAMATAQAHGVEPDLS